MATRARHAVRRVPISNGLCEILLIGTGWVIYALLRGAITVDPANAFGRAERVIDLERQFGVFHEGYIQRLTMSGGQFLVDFANAFYAVGHGPVMIAFAVWIYHANRKHFYRVRNTFFASLGIALVLYFLFPTAPPRLMPENGFVDTMKFAGYAGRESELLLNEFAAIPSLHFGWALIPAVGVFSAYSHWSVRWGALIFFPLATLWSIVATANHFFIDALAGTFVMALAFFIALGWERYREDLARNLLPRRGTVDEPI